MSWAHPKQNIYRSIRGLLPGTQYRHITCGYSSYNLGDRSYPTFLNEEATHGIWYFFVEINTYFIYCGKNELIGLAMNSAEKIAQHCG